MKNHEILKKYLEIISNELLIIPTLDLLDNSLFGVKRKVVCLKGVDKEGFYHFFIAWMGTTRFLVKDALWVNDLHKNIENEFQHSIKNLHLWLPYAPLCSKAKNELAHLKWRIYHDPM